MKIIQVPRTGGPDVLACIDVPRPVPKPNEMLIRAHSIGVGIPDLAIRAGTYRWMPALPAVPGTELSGTVEAIGAAVTKFKPGDRVMAITTYGAFAEEVKTEASRLVPLADGMDFSAA